MDVDKLFFFFLLLLIIIIIIVWYNSTVVVYLLGLEVFLNTISCTYYIVYIFVSPIYYLIKKSSCHSFILIVFLY